MKTNQIIIIITIILITAGGLYFILNGNKNISQTSTPSSQVSEDGHAHEH
jgi:flagellar basal body-associated protein FliL